MSTLCQFMYINEFIIIHFDKYEINRIVLTLWLLCQKAKIASFKFHSYFPFRGLKRTIVNDWLPTSKHNVDMSHFYWKICKIFHILMTSYCSLSLIRRKYVNFNHLTPVKFSAVSSWEGWGWLFQEYFSCGNRRHNYLLECVVFYFGK